MWGLTFPVIKTALETAPAGLFVTLRMLITALILLLYFAITGRRTRFPFDKHGWALMLTFAAGFLLQTYGLQYTTASRSGFLTSLYVIFVPFLVGRIAHEKAPRTAVFAIPVALLGTAILMNPFGAGGQWNIGDWLTIACAVAFAGQIAWTSRLGRTVDPISMLFWPALITAIMNLLVLPFQLDSIRAAQLGIEFWGGLAYAVVGGSLIAIFVMNKFQPKTNATTAAVIYTMEPVYAVIFAVLFFQESVSNHELIGGGLILSANLLAQFHASNQHE